MELRRVAIIGAGAMGASLAGITSRYVSTILVVRNSERAKRIQRYGIQLEDRLSATGWPEVVPSIEALADVDGIDLAFIATKTTAIPEVCAAMRPYLRELPFLVSYQNGIEPAQTIMRSLGTHRMVRMILNYGAALVPELEESEPLRVRVALHAPPHLVGGEGTESTTFARELASLLSTMGLPCVFEPNIEAAAWHKGIANAVTNPVAALLRANLGELLVSPARPLIERLLDEGIAVAKAANIDMPRDFRGAVLRKIEGGGQHIPSMAADIMSARTTEITQLNAQISQRGRELNVPTPTHDTVIELIRTFDWRVAREKN